MIIRPDDPAIRGGIPLKRVPVIPWPAFVACGLKVHHDGKVKMAVFDPEPMETVEEAFQVLRLILSAQGPKPGPLSWETVPLAVQRHFTFPSQENDNEAT
jgi:hypothetical protein